MDSKHLRVPLLIFGLIILGITLLVMIRQTFNREVPPVETVEQVNTNAPFKLTSPVFDGNGPIPSKYTCKGENISPPLSIQNPPTNTKDFVLIMYDADTPDKPKTHWLAWSIPVNTPLIKEGELPAETVAGTSDFNNTNYTGPCTPDGSPAHKYVFELYAINETLNLPPETTKDGLIAAINGKVVAKVQLTGTSAPAQ